MKILEIPLYPMVWARPNFPILASVKICDKEVLYTQRKRCPQCGDWIHNFCGTEQAPPRVAVARGYWNGTPRTICFDCLQPLSTLPQIDAVLKELNEEWEPETFKSGVICLASMQFGPDEKKITELTGYSPADVHLRGERLRASGIWVDDAVALEDNPTNDWRVFNTDLLMNILCADGLIRRLDPEKSAESCTES